jgi:hypothetical protein
MRIFSANVLLVALTLTNLVVCPEARAQSVPLHDQIDQQIAQGHVGPLAPVAGDPDFLRRVYLDLLGTIPSPAEARAFLADPSPDKRTRLIDQLLAQPRHAQHLANVLDVMLMERRPDKYVPAAEWQKYLYDSVLANKPFDVLTREILTSDGVDPATRPAAKFVLEREAEPNLLARDVGRIFFGQDLQCAQCHDHPLVNDYLQPDYYGLLAFFSRTQIFVLPDPDKRTVLMDNATGDVSYQSVFDPTAKGNTLPRVPGGQQVVEAPIRAGEEWTVAPAMNTRHVPKYSRRLQLAGQATAPTNRQFSRNIVNRLWATMMGRGLVEPVDLHHSGNPPTHPELLELLAREFEVAKYDLRWFLRELALSQTYQRSLDLPGDVAAQSAAAASAVATLEAESAQREAAAKQSAAAQSQVATELAAARKTIPPVIDELTKAAAPVPDTQKALAAASQALAEAQGQLTARQDVAKSVVDAAAKAKESVAKLPDEKDLVEAAQTFQVRADQLNAEVATLAKGVEEKTAATKAATDKLAEINRGLDEINVRLSAARQSVIGLEKKFTAASAQARADRYQAKFAERRLAEAQAQTAYATAAAARSAAQTAAEKLTAELTTAQALSAKLTTDLPALQSAQTAATKASEEAQAAAAAARQVRDAKQLAHTEYADVLAKAEAATAKLPQDAELAQVTQKIKARSGQLTAEATATEQEYVAKEEAAKLAAAQLTSATQAASDATTQLAALAASVPALEPQVAAARQQTVETSLAEQRLAEAIPERWSREFASRPLRQLTPEQFGWSVLRATGTYENYVTATAAEIETATPLTEAMKADPAQLAARERQIAEGVHTKLAPSVVVFVQLFGAGSGQPQSDFFATVDQALFLANGGVVKSWLAPSGENLTGRLLKLEDSAQLAAELYLSVFTRLPTEAETAEVTKYLAARPTERPLAVQELAWSLLSSAEFRFNH